MPAHTVVATTGSGSGEFTLLGMRPYKRANQHDVSDDQDHDGRDRRRDQREPADWHLGSGSAFAKSLGHAGGWRTRCAGLWGRTGRGLRKKNSLGGYANPRQQHDHRQGVERRTVGEVIDTKRERSENDGNAGGDKARPEGVAENGVEQDPAHDDLGDRDDEHLRECARQDDRISQIESTRQDAATSGVMTPRLIRTGTVQSTVALVDILGTRTRCADETLANLGVVEHDRVGTPIMGKNSEAFSWALQGCADSHHDMTRVVTDR